MKTIPEKFEVRGLRFTKTDKGWVTGRIHPTLESALSGAAIDFGFWVKGVFFSLDNVREYDKATVNGWTRVDQDVEFEKITWFHEGAPLSKRMELYKNDRALGMCPKYALSIEVPHSFYDTVFSGTRVLLEALADGIVKGKLSDVPFDKPDPSSTYPGFWAVGFGDTGELLYFRNEKLAWSFLETLAIDKTKDSL